MVSDARQTICSRAVILLAAALLSTAPGCTIGRRYVGPELMLDPLTMPAVGIQTKAEVLRAYGPPTTIRRQHDGDVFIYTYVRENLVEFVIMEPFVTRANLFTYTRTDEKRDKLVVLFDKQGLVRSYGYSKDTENLKWY